MNFIDFARAHGVTIDKLYSGDRIHRCATVLHPKSKSGAYFWDGARGWVFAWDGEARVEWFNDPKATPWTDAEKDAWRMKRLAAQSDQDADQMRAAAKAQAMLNGAKQAEHNYFHMKGFPAAHGFVAADGALLIPMRDVKTNALNGLQSIQWVEADRSYLKKMIFGMKAKGAVFRIGDRTAPEAFLCEGYATGLSIAAAVRSAGLRASVVVCFSAGNMRHVAPLVAGRKYVFADHDKSGTGEKVAIETGLPYCMSPVTGEDANDLHARAGLFSVVGLLMQVRRKEIATN